MTGEDQRATNSPPPSFLPKARLCKKRLCAISGEDQSKIEIAPPSLLPPWNHWCQSRFDKIHYRQFCHHSGHAGQLPPPRPISVSLSANKLPLMTGWEPRVQ